MPSSTPMYNSTYTHTYLLKKSVKASSGTIATEFFTFSTAEKYKRIALANADVTEIISCVDSDSNSWYEVPFLAQDTVYADFQNNTKKEILVFDI